MKDYLEYLQSRHIASKKSLPYYVSWVSKFYAFCHKETGADVSADEIEKFLKNLSSTCEEWQIKQAHEAIKLYLFFLKKKIPVQSNLKVMSDNRWKAVSDDMVNILRLKHRSFSTERSYLAWLRTFYGFVKGNSPELLESSDVIDFMTFLAVEKKVAKSTQNQAFNAVLFL